jgi:hypothetical protein
MSTGVVRLTVLSFDKKNGPAIVNFFIQPESLIFLLLDREISGKRSAKKIFLSGMRI